ncbi:DUF3606 domain-containing protein [Bordetella genomosp. 13]|uniref:DUF3606 domain-containing protein n=1 Tax=Bordetella genomosp. 13 TaxID=463040 RepID=A0A1W6ZCV7_9BORD|nr:DUF3606 domain-containing protein [Bordetella genomosp. 13]ARP95169.1 DUF3606 domain-containing protein [Bordetella genomosp. 13]
MTDNLNNRGPQDRSRINVEEEWECRYWSEKLGVTDDQLREAVHQVGTSVEDVTAYLQTPATGRTS